MVKLDLIMFLVAAVIGAGQFFPESNRVAWGVVGIWALLRLLGAL